MPTIFSTGTRVRRPLKDYNCNLARLLGLGGVFFAVMLLAFGLVGELKDEVDGVAPTVVISGFTVTSLSALRNMYLCGALSMDTTVIHCIYVINDYILFLIVLLYIFINKTYILKQNFTAISQHNIYRKFRYILQGKI